MSIDSLPTAKQLKNRCQTALSFHSVFVIGIVFAFFYPLLNLRQEQFTVLLFLLAPFGVLSWIAFEAFYAVALKPIATYLDALHSGETSEEMCARAFHRITRFPQICITCSFLNYFLAGVISGVFMDYYFETFTFYHCCILVISISVGGGLGQILNFILTKDVLAPVRIHLASQITNIEEREALVQPIPLATKLAVTLTGLMVATVFFCVFLTQKRATDTIESFLVSQQERVLDQFVKATEEWEDLDTAHFAMEEDLALVEMKIDFLAFETFPSEAEKNEPRVDEEELAQFSQRTGINLEELRFILKDAFNEETDWSVISRGDSLRIDTTAVYSWRVIPEEETLIIATPLSDQKAGGASGLGWSFFVLLLGAGAISLFVALRVASDLSRGADAVNEQLQRIAAGDLTRGNCFESEDEFGMIARSVERTAVSLRGTVGQVQTASGQLENATQEFVAISESVTDSSKMQGIEIKQVTHSMDSITTQIRDITRSSEELNTAVDDSATAITQLGNTGEALHETSSEVNTRVGEIGSSIQEMLFSIQQITQNSSALAEIASESAGSVKQTANSVQEVESNAQETARLANGVIKSAEEGHARVRETIDGMEAIREATAEAQEVTNSLGESAQEIGAIVNVINSVADETSLLALNAAIIAAQAGEHGRAFSVVADEIKDLASRVLTSTKEIDSRISAVQEESARAVRVIERGSGSVQSGVERSNQAGVSLDEIMRSARESGGHIQQIVTAVREHAMVANHMVSLIEKIGSEVERIEQAGLEHAEGASVIHKNAINIEEATDELQRSSEEQAQTTHHINEHVDSVRESTSQIQGALEEQSRGCQMVTDSLGLIAERTSSNEDSVLRMEEATKVLLRQRDDLRDSIRQFKLQEDAEPTSEEQL